MNRPFKLKAPHVLERVEQEALFQWAAVMERHEPRLRLLNASLNGVRLTLHQAVMAKKGGMKKGYPDVFLPVPAQCWPGLFIELKRKDGVASDVSKEQRQWINDLREQGYHAVVCYGWESAAQVIGLYLGMDQSRMPATAEGAPLQRNGAAPGANKKPAQGGSLRRYERLITD